MARHQRMPTLEAGYTYAVEPTVIKQVTCKRGGVHIRTLAGIEIVEAHNQKADPEAVLYGLETHNAWILSIADS